MLRNVLSSNRIGIKVTSVKLKFLKVKVNGVQLKTFIMPVLKYVWVMLLYKEEQIMLSKIKVNRGDLEEDLK